ncbi:16S rRNA pseudouridine(516) synthase [Neptuniibacter sp. QD72_48]|uniref:16S rRNA pseudouridine(516) synthase n=1 Tax=unclassified Neptuniibacter TaxID=2630693 RepID=UPI0039F4F03A
MAVNKSRLDRFLASRTSYKRGDVRLLIAQQKIMVDGFPALAANQVIDRFSIIECDGEVLQDNRPIYLMMNKPVGYVSATKDSIHPTVIDLLTEPYGDMHIAGRLDLNSTGLLLITNDGEWSSKIASPDRKVPKRYKVDLAKPLSEEYVPAFKAGMYFPYEDITTKPADIEIIDTHSALVTLQEGRYHQIKRMFGRFRNPVVGLKRLSIGDLDLDVSLSPGESRELVEEEVALFTSS